MAILMISDASEETLAQYDQVIMQLKEAGQEHPAGRQFHVAARKGAGYVVSDVWESEEALDRFRQTLGPLLQQAGSTQGPQTTQILPVHNIVMGS